jgi:hypothetical protein
MVAVYDRLEFKNWRLDALLFGKFVYTCYSTQFLKNGTDPKWWIQDANCSS